MTATTDTAPDYGTPMQFLIAMLLFTFIGYHVESLMGVWTMIWLSVWLVFTGYFYVKWRKGNGQTGDGGWFGLLIVTLSIAGLFVESWLNVESYVLLVIWAVIASMGYSWLKKNPKADKRIYYLLSMQFLLIAILMPLLMRFVNPVLMEICPCTEVAAIQGEKAVHGYTTTEPVLIAANTATTHAADSSMESASAAATTAEHDSHATSAHANSNSVALSLIGAFNTLTFLISLWLSWLALRLGMANSHKTALESLTEPVA